VGKRKSDEILLKHLHRQMMRPGQAPGDAAEYWIVINLSPHKQLHYMPPRFPFRHPSLESAITEANRLAGEPDKLGWRFGVFHFTGIAAKVEVAKPDEAPAVEVEQQAA